MNDENEIRDEEQQPSPANPGSTEKTELPDPDMTDPSTMPTVAEEIDEPVESTRFNGEHHISSEHAEPTDVTRTSNDNYIEGEYIDVGGGD